MKSILLVFTFLFSLTATAQIDYPNLRPELLEGTTVTIRKLSGTVLDKEYKGFYAEKSVSKPYKGNRHLNPEVLEGRTFKVLAVEPYNSELFAKENRWIRLEDTTSKEIVYYQYRLKGNYLEYYFIVDGGLKVPEDFFCDYVTGWNTATGNYLELEVPGAVTLERRADNGKISYSLTASIYMGTLPATTDEGAIVIIMANGNRIEIKDGYCYLFKGSMYAAVNNIPESTIKQIGEGDPVRIEFNKGYNPLIKYGYILSGGARCMMGKPVK